MLFRKIVSNLPYSPALLNQLGFYAKRLKKEEMTRRLGLLFTALALILQIFSLLSPPEAALATNPNNLVFNGINSKEDLLNAWDRNTDGHGHDDIQQVFKYFLGDDFSRKDLEETQKGTFGSRDKVNGGRILTLGRSQQTSDPAQKAYAVKDARGGKTAIWSRHLDAFDAGASKSGRGSVYDGYIGSHDGKWFAVMSDCGGIAFPDTHEPPSPTPQLMVQATCREINGYAYAKANLKASLKVYLYLDGGPGKGEKFTTTANSISPDDGVSGSHGFTFSVPVKYHTGKTYDYSVVAAPLDSNDDATQFNGTIATSSCKTPEPVVQCQSLKVTPKNRTTFTFTGKASASDNAKITGYHYTVTDKNKVVVFDKTYATTEPSHTAEDITLPEPGDYTAKLAVVTPQGEKTTNDCTMPLTVVPENKCILNAAIPASDKDCKPCPGDSSLWVKDAECAPQIIKSKSVKNLTQIINDANNTTAHPGDRIEYDLYIENAGSAPTTISIDENLADVLEYATLANFSGQDPALSFNKDTGILSWKNIALAPKQTIMKSIVVEVKTVIPATPTSVGNLESYDCTMGNVFGGSRVILKVQCPEEKIIENTIQELPQTGTGANILFGTVLLIVVTYFYARARQMRREVKSIRKEFNYGTI